ncbi:FG-GAP-like repeat-containing protein [Marininema halotolerans]|uniref:HYR domain-containing protein n=1 Tax=Marininema halotolerans TaxID=1155944 RepID=A0A1I6TKS8_9BACL|nr:FG-GAP-like repeat-containing protein [Marininema halotolerans]SFS89775.1 HYR domain-containing protein [Marininema halotolerans]
MVCPSYLSLGSTPTGGTAAIYITTADFNNDDVLDLAITNQNSVNFSVFLGNGDGTFTAAPGSPIGSGGTTPQGIVSADFDNDGFIDLALVNNGPDTVAIFLGNGDGTFTPAPGSPFPSGGTNPVGIVAGDFNNDSITDIAITNNGNNTISVFLGNGGGTFISAAGSPFLTGGVNPLGIITADFNNDGNLDLANANVNDVITLFLGNGNGTFTPSPASPIVVGDLPFALASSDLNNDGNLDLAVSNLQSNNLTILLGDGTGGFTNAPGSPIAIGGSPREVVITHVNCDDVPDIAINQLANNSISALIGNGDGTFQTPSTFTVGGGPVGLVTGDFNNDGVLDLSSANINGSNFTVLLNNCVQSLTCSDITTENEVGLCGATVSFEITTPQCDNVSTTTDPASGSFFEVGTNLVTATATSSVGDNSEVCTFSVTVNDTEPPMISDLNDIDVQANNNIGTIVYYPEPTVTDNCPGIITFTCTPASGSFFPIGATTVTCTATDTNTNRSSTESFTVTVIPFIEE